MTIAVTYRVDDALYFDSEHDVSLETTEYAYGGDLLVHMWIGKSIGSCLGERLEKIFTVNMDVESDQFFQKSASHNGIAQLTTRDLFEEKLQRFDKSQTVVEKEILEEYAYVGKDGRPGSVRISVKSKGGRMTAVIYFADTEHLYHFVSPAWLKPFVR
jgi:hypothetical protein